MKKVMVAKRGNQMPVVLDEKYIGRILKMFSEAGESTDMVVIYGVPSGTELTMNLVGEVVLDRLYPVEKEVLVRHFARAFLKAAKTDRGQVERTLRNLMENPLVMSINGKLLLMHRAFYSEIRDVVNNVRTSGEELDVKVYLIENDDWEMNSKFFIATESKNLTDVGETADKEKLLEWIEESSLMRKEIVIAN